MYQGGVPYCFNDLDLWHRLSSVLSSPLWASKGETVKNKNYDKKSKQSRYNETKYWF